MASVSQGISNGAGLVLVQTSARVPTNHGYRKKKIKVLVDTGAQHCVATTDLLFELEELKHPLRLKGIAGTTAVKRRGVCSLQLPCKDSTRWVRVNALELTQPIGNAESKIDLALSASVSRALGLHDQQVVTPTTDVSQLPSVKCKWKRPSSSLEKASYTTTILTTMQLSGPLQILSIAEETTDGQLLLAHELEQTVRTAEMDRTVKWKSNEEPIMGLLIDSYIEKSLVQHPLHAKGEKVASIDDIYYGKPPNDCDSQEDIDRCRRLVAEFTDVFSEEALPTQAKFDPIKIELTSAAPLPKIRTTNWTPAERKYLEYLRKQWVSFGIVKKAQGVIAICRLTLARKSGGKIRCCYDGRQLNKHLLLRLAGYSTMMAQIQRASSDKKYKSQFDFHSAFLQLPIAESSQKYLGLMLPDDNGEPTMYQFQRLPFGLSISPGIMVECIDHVLSSLDPELRMRIAVYIDDLVISSDSIEEHLADLRALFGACRKFDLSLNPTKARVLTASSLVFLGRTCGRGTCSQGHDNVEAVRKMLRPTSKAEVMHVLGVFGVSRDFIEGYAGKVQPLTDLLKKKKDFTWGSQQQKAFDNMKRELTEVIHLAQFDPSKQLIIHTDASQYACGAWVAQNSSKGLQTIAVYSTTFSEAQRSWSAFQREAYALLYSLSKATVYMHACKKTTLVYSDAHSLQFVQSATRSALSSRLLAKSANLRYQVIHIAGIRNTVADALSRMRMVAPRELSTEAKLDVLEQLLEQLPPESRHTKKVGLYYVGMQELAAKMVQQWRKERSALVQKRSLLRLEEDVELAIIHSAVVDQVDVARKWLRTDKPVCILMALDLVVKIYWDDEVRDEVLEQAVSAAAKIPFLARNYVWLIHGVAANSVVMLTHGVDTVGRQSVEEKRATDREAITVDLFLRMANVNKEKFSLQMIPDGVVEILARSPRVGGKTKQYCEQASFPTLKEHVYQKVKEWVQQETNSQLVLPTMVDNDLEIHSGAELAAAIKDAVMKPWEADELYTPSYGSTKHAIDSLVAKLDATAWKDDFEEKEWKEYNTDTRTWLKPNGTKWWRTKKSAVLIVPKKHVVTVCQLAHELLGHASHSRVATELKKIVFWFGLSRDVKQVDGGCGRCNIARLNKIKLHGLYKARHYFLPRAGWSMDVKRVAVRGQPPMYLLAAIDCFSGYAVVMVLRRRTVKAVVEGIEHDIVYRYGIPAFLTSDYAGEFGERFKGWCTRNGIKQTQPVPEYSPANSKVERFWPIVQAAMRSLTDSGIGKMNYSGVCSPTTASRLRLRDCLRLRFFMGHRRTPSS